MVKKWDITIPELTGTTKRRAYIYLPESYHEDTNRRYPTLYMFDGHNVFFDSDATYGKCWGMKEYMDATETDMIIVAVECNHEGNERLSEYSPFSFTEPKIGKIVGKGKVTMDWLTKTFKPWIDRHYRTLSDRNNTFIGGSSMGGLMSLYGVLKYNHVFSKAAALSPSIWLATNQLEAMILTANISPDTVIYMDYGSREMKFHTNMEYMFGQVTSLFLERRIQLTSRIVPEGNHCEASWEKQIPFFMSVLQYKK